MIGIIWKCKNFLYFWKDKYVKDKECCEVWDHCHYTGEYRGAGHSTRNLKYSIPKEIAILFHSGLTMILILSKKS